MRDKEITRDLQRTAYLAQAIDLAYDDVISEARDGEIDERRLRAVLHRHLALAWDDAERRTISLRQQVILLSARLAQTKRALHDALRRINDGR